MRIDLVGRDEEAREEWEGLGAVAFLFFIHRETRVGAVCVRGCMGGRFCGCFFVMCWLDGGGRRRMRCCPRGRSAAVQCDQKGGGGGLRTRRRRTHGKQMRSCLLCAASPLDWLAGSLRRPSTRLRHSQLKYQSRTRSAAAPPSSHHRRCLRTSPTEWPRSSLACCSPSLPAKEGQGGVCSVDRSLRWCLYCWAEGRHGWPQGCVCCR